MAEFDYMAFSTDYGFYNDVKNHKQYYKTKKESKYDPYEDLKRQAKLHAMEKELAVLHAELKEATIHINQCRMRGVGYRDRRWVLQEKIDTIESTPLRDL